MKAAVLSTPGALHLTDWPEPEIGPGDVLIAVRGVGVCGTDLAILSGRRQPRVLPMVIGHEAAGVVLEAGSAVRDRAPGAWVAVEPNIPDLSCDFCKGGRTSLCPNREAAGVTRDGFLAERISVPAEFTWPMPPVDVRQLICVEPFAVAQSAVRRSGSKAGERCLVIGAGAQGLFVTLALQQRGAHVVVDELQESRLELAMSLGAERWLAGEADFDCCFETSGTSIGFTTAVARVKRGGTVMLIGESNEPSNVTSLDLVLRQVTIRGSLIYDHPDDFAKAAKAVARGDIPVDRILGTRHAFDDAMSAFASAGRGLGKSWISVPD